MKKENIKVDEYSYNSLISKADKFEQAQAILAEMKKAGLNPNQITFNTILRKASQENCYEAILTLLSEMRQKRVKPQIKGNYTANAIKTCIKKNRKRFLDWSKAQNWQEAWWQEFFKNF